MTSPESVLAAANRHVKAAIDAHHAAGRSTYVADEDGRVFEETPQGSVFEVRNTETGTRRIRLVHAPRTALGGPAL